MALSHPDKFVNRHIGIDPADLEEMLQQIKAKNLDQLMFETIPDDIRLNEELKVPRALTESEMLAHMREIGAKNKLYKTYIGMGYYNTITPSVIRRNIFENPGWYTQYTPYQAEISQGRLEALLNYQTMVCDLTGLPVANASLLDEATAAAEAMTMLHEAFMKTNRGSKADTILVAPDVYPQTVEVLEARAEPLGLKILVAEVSESSVENPSVFGILLQYPGMYGEISDYRKLVAFAKERGIYTAVAADLMSLALLTPPGEWGAAIVLGNTQRFGVPLGYGGPHAAYMAAEESFTRQMPGRIIGVSADRMGNRALRMALQTREQHIRRDKATSNICTAQALLAVMAGMYAVYHGPKGIKAIATYIHQLTGVLRHGLESFGPKIAIQNKNHFDTLSISASEGFIAQIKTASEAKQINFGYTDEHILISLDETSTPEDVEKIWSVFAEVLSAKSPSMPENAINAIPEDLTRSSSFLQHPTFNRFHSETDMMRYIKRLEKKDLSLMHSMIPLGSCTMKLNAAAQLYPVSWPEFSSMHPFVPIEQATGYQQIFDELSDYLCVITGFVACSLQPNSGAQGEYAGLLSIRAYHHDRNEDHRNVALIPSSAHGTNPASAVMAGMKVVVVKCDDQGNIDLEDLREKADKYTEHLSCLMVTYPSTHGVFETAIREICRVTHENGGLVYMDGANMNAQVGFTNPATIGADVCHLNLHKTFAIPHGGGGPGMGPILVNEKLKPYLPGHSLMNMGRKRSMKAISAAPWGSASILLISYAYIRLLGRKGLKASTAYAVLNSNYIKARLEDHYKILYLGTLGRTAHELIVDLRPFKAICSAEDVAKRLIDYGFHAPTLAFPVPGTIMIEPTESESKEELDRFCEAMISIRAEIDAIASGDFPADDNVLKNAPHPVQEITADDWHHAYSRREAAFPMPWVHETKFWVDVARVDNAKGDRNLICTCPPIEAYEMEENA